MSQIPPLEPDPAADMDPGNPSLFTFTGVLDSALTSMKTTDQLRRLGYNFTFENNGMQRIILADYPGRPGIDFFRNPDEYLTPPVGAIVQFLSSAHAHIRNNVTRYTLNLPTSLGDSLLATTDPSYDLFQLEQTANNFNATHDTNYLIPQIIQMHHAYHGDIEKILAALSLDIPGKQVADMLNMGYTHEEILQLHHAPISLIFDGAPDRSKL